MARYTYYRTWSEITDFQAEYDVEVPDQVVSDIEAGTSDYGDVEEWIEDNLYTWSPAGFAGEPLQPTRVHKQCVDVAEGKCGLKETA